MSKINYRIITTIKNTEKSQVYLATMEGQEDPVIIKKMKTANPEVYKVLQEVHNRHIPQIYGMESQEDELIVAEEYVDGETLEYYLKEELLTEEQKLKVALQLCEAVGVLHNCAPQIIHRDIKPSNVLITESGVLKLIDFDVSRQYKKASGDSDTRILGTADYAAPEQFGYHQTDVRSDIYSMGVVLEILDFKGTGFAKLLWNRMIAVATNFDPKKRYKSVSAMEKVIDRVWSLLKYQWYAIGVACVIVLLIMSACFLRKPVNEEQIPSNTEIDTTTQMYETEVSTETEDFIETESSDESYLEVIESELQNEYVSEYFQGENVDFFFYSDSFENDIRVLDATLIELVSYKRIHVNESARVENSIFMIDAEFMQTLKPSYYKLRIELVDKDDVHSIREIHIRVFSKKDTFVENEYSLETNYLDYHYETYDKLHIIVCSNTKFRIAGLHLVNIGPIDANLYHILYDGRAAELSADLLEQCKNTKEILFEVEFDNGKRERLIIANPYLE